MDKKDGEFSDQDYFVLASISSGQPVYMKVKIYSTEERVVSWGFE